jgi:hypothetical protein
MKPVLLELADGSFLVSPETAAKLASRLPPDRFVTVTSGKDDDDDDDDDEDDEDDDDNGNNKKKSDSVFDKYQHPLTQPERNYAQRMARHLTKSTTKHKSS